MTRRALRRRLLLLGLLPLLLALAFAAKVGSMLVLDRDGRASYDASQWGAARGSFAANTTLNVLEPWVAPYGEGTARYREGDFGEAVRALETSLLDVPSEQECLVRINLSLAHEGVGDSARAAQDPTAARVAYRAGVVALGDCLALDAPAATPATTPATTPAEAQVADARAVDSRLRQKLAEARAAEEAAEQAPEDAAEAEQQETLEERNQQGEDQRDKTEQRQQDEQDEQQQPEQQPTQSPSDDSTEPPPPVYEW